MSGWRCATANTGLPRFACGAWISSSSQLRLWACLCSDPAERSAGREDKTTMGTRQGSSGDSFDRLTTSRLSAPSNDRRPHYHNKGRGLSSCVVSSGLLHDLLAPNRATPSRPHALGRPPRVRVRTIRTRRCHPASMTDARFPGGRRPSAREAVSKGGLSSRPAARAAPPLLRCIRTEYSVLRSVITQQLVLQPPPRTVSVTRRSVSLPLPGQFRIT